MAMNPYPDPLSGGTVNTPINTPIDWPTTRWHVEDSRTPGKRASMSGFFTQEQAERQIESWRKRDARGGRPDIHDLMPYLIAVEGP